MKFISESAARVVDNFPKLGAGHFTPYVGNFLYTLKFDLIIFKWSGFIERVSTSTEVQFFRKRQLRSPDIQYVR